ncbi:MAG TPA: SLC13 family permease [Bacteroidia bacterium]|nr:SLC13 family permease [Bacteroidia bacterium]
MTFEIALTLLVILLTLVAFIREWAPPDVLALSLLCLVVALGLVDPAKMTDVFKNEAPLTIAALFVIGGALEASGAVDRIGNFLKSWLSGDVRKAILAFSLMTAFFGAWMNNTAIVAILLPVTLGFARSKEIAPSRLLMPLSYASILGGCCTLIGTSTNLLVSGTLRDLGLEPLSMFEITPLGVPLAIAGVAYLSIFGEKLIPSRASITGGLEIEQRTTPLYHVLVADGSPIIGQRLAETELMLGAGIHIVEIRRDGTRVRLPLTEVVVRRNDRYLVALPRRRGREADPEQFFDQFGAKVLSTVDGIVSDLVVSEESSLVGKTMANSDFRQRYNCVVLAVHRDGANVEKSIGSLRLEGGDTLLVVTPKSNLETLEATRDFVMTDVSDDSSPEEQRRHHPGHAALSWSTLIGVVVVATVSDYLNGVWPWIPAVPIHYAALVGALLLLWLKVVTPREAYASIDWQVLLMLYGLLGLGMAMQSTGTAEWLARSLVDLAEHLVAREHLPILMLWLIFLLTLALTEVLSNNATAVMMVPIVLTMAVQLGVDARPYIMAVTVAASTAFALPMGYQTHMMIYGPGGYRFTDFLRVGIPLNLICWVTACLLIPLIWPFKVS